MSTRFILIRHAETTWNRERRIQGQVETDLTEEGRRAARQWAPCITQFAPDIILTSDLKRAVDTARLATHGHSLPLETDERLREQYWGSWQGRTLADLYENEADELARQEAARWDFRPGGGESRAEVLDRAITCLREAAMRHEGKTILAVSHLGVVKNIIYRLLGCTFNPDEPSPVAKRAVHVLSCNEGIFQLKQYNVELPCT